MEATSTDDDRISQLPESISHHILSLLDSPAELLRMSVLSNYWFALTASFPILNFDIRQFPISEQSFFKYVEYTTSRFCHQNVTSTHTFKLITTIDDDEPSEVDVIDNCLGFILNKGVQVLFVIVVTKPSLPVYRLPNLLLSTSSLTSLSIHSCGLPSSLMVDDFKFGSLKLLHLSDVHVDDEMIKRLTSNCPLLEEFNLFHCHGYNSICVYRHQNLRKVKFYLVHGVERIDIEAPNLRFLYLYNSSERDAPLLNLFLCKKLTRVDYSGFPSPKATLFPDFLSSFPFIVILDLKLPNDCRLLKLSSSSLRVVDLHSECDLEEIDIDTPNLLLFVYKNRSDTPAPLAIISPRMECFPKNDVDALWFQKLRRFLDKKNAFKVLNLHISSKFMDIDELNRIQSPPYELQHVELELETINDLSLYLDVVDAVLWCCRPRSLTLRSNFSVFDFKKRIQLVEFTYEMLLAQERKDEGQTNIQFVLSSSSKPKKNFSNLDSLLTAFPRDHLIHTITFIKEQVL